MLNKFSNKRLPLVVLFIGIVLSLASMKIVQNTVDNKETLRISSTASEIGNKISQSVNIMKYGLGGANGIFAASEIVSKKEFRDYVDSRNIDAEFPGATGFGFISILERENIPTFLEKMKRENREDFKIKTSGSFENLYVIKYIEPLEYNTQALGLDIGSDTRRREAAELAMKTGKPVLTRKLQLVQDSRNEAGFLYLKPVYKNSLRKSTEAERIQSIMGWVYCPITLEKTLSKVIEEYGSLFNIAVYDGLEDVDQELLYKSPNYFVEKSEINLRVQTIEVGQRKWMVYLSPKHAFYSMNSDQYLPLAVLVLGMLVSIIMSYALLHNIKLRHLSYRRQIQEGEDFINGIIDSANFSIIVTSPAGEIRVFNKTSERMLKYRAEEVIGKQSPAIFHDFSEIEKRAQELSEELGVSIEPGFDVFTAKSRRGLPDVSEWIYLRKDKTSFPVSLSITPVKNYKNEIIAYVGIGDDISEKKIVETKIRESEERFKSSFSHASHGIALVGMKGEWLKANFALCQMLGRTEEELMSLTFQDITHPEDLNIDLDLMDKTIKNEIENYHIEKRYFHKSGNIIWVLLSVSLVRSEDGTPIHFVSQIQNITEQKQAETALSESKAQLELLVESTFSATWDWQIDLNRIDFSRTWVNIIGYELEDITELKYEEFIELIHVEDRAGFENAMTLFLEESVSNFQYEYRIKHRDGHYIWVSDTGKVVCLSKDNRPTRVLGTHLDISKRKAQEQELINAKESAISAGESKSQFLANMSHEIRTPLTSIIGYSESLQEDVLSEEEKTFALSTVLKNGSHLLRVINDILDLSKIEAGKLNVEIIPTDLTELLSDVANLMQHRAREKNLSIGFEYEYPIPQVIWTDPIRLKQILINLLGNAVKFTSHGGVKIMVSYRPKESRMMFSVVDTGPGLSKDQQEKLFQAFSQGDTSITRKFGGTGLGLVISSELARKLGGEISIDSELGRGSVFTISIATGEVKETDYLYELKNKEVKQSNTGGVKAPTLNGRVLVAEDGEDNRSLISFLLSKTGVEYEMVENGALAVKKAESGNFDLILMDIQMPVMDGYTAMTEIRNMGIDVPIIALTANAMKADIEAAYENKCTDFLGKPFHRAEFFEKIELNLKKKLLPIGVSNPSYESKCEAASVVPEDSEELKMIQNIVAKFAKRFDELIQSYESADWDGLYRAAHSIKGATSIIGLSEIASVAAEIEKLAKKKDDDVTKKFQKIKLLMEKVENSKDVMSLCDSSSIFLD